MSGADQGTTPGGRGTGGDGGDKANSRRRRSGTAQSAASNQTLLVVDSNLLSGLTEQEARDLAIVQLEFARDVSERSLVAYNRILAVLTRPAIEDSWQPPE